VKFNVLKNNTGSVPIVASIVLSGVLFIFGKNSIDHSVINFKSASDLRISDDLSGNYLSAFKKVDQYVQSRFVDTKKRGDCNSGLEVSFRGKEKGFTSFSGNTFTVNNCVANKFSKGDWNSLISSHKRIANCPSADYKVKVEKAVCNEKENFLIAKVEKDASSALGYSDKKKYIKKESVAKIDFIHDPKLNCAEARADGPGKIKTGVVNVVIPSTMGGGPKCSNMGKGGAAEVHGIHTQKIEAKFPKGVLMCGIKVKGLSKKFVYDDGFALTMNGRVLATGRMGTNKFDNDDDEKELKKFDYDDIKGKNYGSTGKEGCAVETEDSKEFGKGCSVPQTETYGELKINPTDEINSSFGNIVDIDNEKGTISKENMVVFEMHVTGDDNEDIDCRHNGLALVVTYEYVDAAK
jgi:hypothetical protein